MGFELIWPTSRSLPLPIVSLVRCSSILLVYRLGWSSSSSSSMGVWVCTDGITYYMGRGLYGSHSIATESARRCAVRSPADEKLWRKVVRCDVMLG